ncbi:hypothetical protein Tco_0632951, partial [Tanacetum coccineum]
SSSENISSDSDNNSSDSASTSEEIVYSSLKCKSSRGPSKNISKAKACILAKASESSSKAKVQASRSKAKVQASMAQASPKTLIVKSPVPITNCVFGLANAKTWDSILSKTFGVKIPPTITCAEEKKGKRKIEDSSDDNKGVPKEGPSITSVPEDGPSIQGLLDWYGYDTIEEYLEDTYFPSTDKDNTDEDTIHESYSSMFKAWDDILKKIGVRKPEIYADKAKGKRKVSYGS